jgi:hypothetical protein
VHSRCNTSYIGKHSLSTARALVEYLRSNFDGRKL